jgi:hemerythrin-like domain-containing protein
MHTDTATTPDVDSYLRVHRALRASAAQLAEATTRPAEARTRRARARWFKGFADEIESHHRIEDELLFPAIAARVATYPELAQRLESDHRELDDLLAGLTAALGSTDTAPGAALAAALRDHLDEHLAFEDAEVAPLFVRHFTAEEYEQLDARAVKMTPFKQMLFTAPWLISHLDEADRDALLATVPKALTILWIATRGRYARLTARAFS